MSAFEQAKTGCSACAMVKRDKDSHDFFKKVHEGKAWRFRDERHDDPLALVASHSLPTQNLLH